MLHNKLRNILNASLLQILSQSGQLETKPSAGQLQAPLALIIMICGRSKVWNPEHHWNLMGSWLGNSQRFLEISLKSVGNRTTNSKRTNAGCHMTSLPEVMRLPRHPSSPEWPERGVKMLSGHFQALTDSLMGWWQASSSWTGSKTGPSYKSKRNSFPCYPPAST